MIRISKRWIVVLLAVLAISTATAAPSSAQGAACYYYSIGDYSAGIQAVEAEADPEWVAWMRAWAYSLLDLQNPQTEEEAMAFVWDIWGMVLASYCSGNT